MKMPTAFISHGAPDRVLNDSSSNLFLRNFASLFSKPSGIVIISAHWQTQVPSITTAGNLTAKHDFYGFSDELYRVNYQVEQTQALTQQVYRTLNQHGEKIDIIKRNLDHGSWSVLSLAFPEADIPVVNMSLPNYPKFAQYVELGKQLNTLREQGILIIGSGSATHNLSALSRDSTPPVWAEQFVKWLHHTVTQMNLDALANLYQQAPHAKRAHPTAEHYLPLLIAAGAASDEQSRLIHDSYEYSALNNSSFLFGEFN
ncbi:class III extradiol ring-cleavage dioxygenase [Colwelliaceae bacterium 6441]